LGHFLKINFGESESVGGRAPSARSIGRMLWALLSARFRAFLIFAVALPLGAFVLRRVARLAERRWGPQNRFSTTLHQIAQLASRSGT
jgi:hypothetical protein